MENKPDHSSLLDRTAPSSWFLLRVLGQPLQRLVKEWRLLPFPLRRRWVRSLLLGWLATGIVMVVLGAVSKSMSVAGSLAFESQLLDQMVAQLPLSFDQAIWMGAPSNPVFLTTLTLGLGLIAAWRRYPLASLTIFASFFMVDVVIILGWLTWNRPRPELVYGGAAVPGLHSFPSGHMAQATAVYGLLLYLWWHYSRSRAEQIVVFAATSGLLTLVALTRLRLGVHWPSDIVAGFVIGLIWAGILAATLHRAWSQLACVEAEAEGD